jgi:predicted FMN-binding regulatory protein PaiB
MYRSDKYPVDPVAVAAFVAGQRHGTLIATPPDGHPQISILPFVHNGDRIELHCVQEDATFAGVRANPRVTFLVSDFLAFSRHDWVDPEDAGRATLNFRAVAFECEATTSTDPGAVAGALSRLLAAYEPDADYVPIAADNPLYGSRIERLAVIQLQIVHTEAKFKVGPAAPVNVKQQVVAGLRQRNGPGDARAADVIEAALPHK